MTSRRLLLVLLGTCVVLGSVPLSAALVTSGSTSTGRIGAAADWTPPAVAVQGDTALVRGTVTLTALATDSHSAVREVRIEVRPESSTGVWTPVCTSTASPYSCSWNTTPVPDGRHLVRAVATDLHGNATTSASALRTVDNSGPVVAVDETAMADYLRGTVTVPVTATDAGGVASVRVQRSVDGKTWTDVCTDTTSPFSCPWPTTGAGDWQLRAIAVDITGNSTTSTVVTVAVDNVAPAVTMTSPGTTLSGTVTLTATASDADSGVASVAIDYRASSTGPWTPVCTDPTAPYSCRWDTTTVADGTAYAFRATATDQAGNIAGSAVTGTSAVDNRLAAVSLDDPGQYFRGTATLTASAQAPGGVKTVAIQYAPTGTTTWVTICTATTAPFTCGWDTTRVTGGSYDLRAVMTPNTGSPLTSALVTGRIVDNAALRGTDVQATNAGQLGRVEVGDTIALTYDSVVNLETVVAGWTGAARSVTVRLRDGNLAGTAGGEDVLDVFTTTALGTPVHVGTVNTRGDYVKGGQTQLLTATMTAGTTTVNGLTATRIVITIDALASADVRRTAKGSRTMTWTPSAAARDLAGNPASTAPVTELGTLDRDL